MCRLDQFTSHRSATSNKIFKIILHRERRIRIFFSRLRMRTEPTMSQGIIIAVSLIAECSIDLFVLFSSTLEQELQIFRDICCNQRRNRDTSSTLTRATHIELLNDKHGIIETRFFMKISYLNFSRSDYENHERYDNRTRIIKFLIE